MNPNAVEFWIGEGQKKALRVANSANGTTHLLDNGLHWSEAIGAECTKTARRLFGLLAPDSEDAIASPNGTLYDKHEQRQVFLAWCDRNLPMNAAIASHWIKQGYVTSLSKSAVMLDGLHPAIMTEPEVLNSSHPDAPKHGERQMHMLASIRATFADGKNGRIAREHLPEGWTRMVACIPHVHGSDEGLDFMQEVDLFPSFFRHQYGVWQSGSALRNTAPSERFSLFLETFPATRNQWDEKNLHTKMLLEEKCDDLVQMVVPHLRDDQHLRAIGKTLTGMAKTNPLASAVSLHSIRGSFLVARDVVKHGGEQRIYGDGRLDYQGDKDSDYYKFELPHTELTRNIHRNVHADCGLGVLIYGSAHYITNNGKRVLDRQGTCLEDYLSHIPRTAFIVVEPPGILDYTLKCDVYMEQLRKNVDLAKWKLANAKRGMSF